MALPNLASGRLQTNNTARHPMHIALRNISKRYGKVRALDSVSLELAPGQLVAVLGLNGAGKTTLLNCLAGLAGIDRGELHVDGKRFTREQLNVRRRMVFIPDAPLLFWEKSVVRNVGIFLRLHEAVEPDTPERVTQLLEHFDLLPLADALVCNLSRGQIYKTALVAAIAVNPMLWLLDEPFASGIDPHAINQFKRHAHDAVARGATVIYTTQLLDLAERFSDRVIVLHQGGLKASGTMNDLRAQAMDKTRVLDELFVRLREPDL
jgi:ABC-type multidrug transport system ATPase subunit